MKSIEDIKDRLLRLDEDASLLFGGDDRFICIIVGGSALILLGYLTRATHDIDMLCTPSELLELLEKYDMNTNAHTWTISRMIILSAFTSLICRPRRSTSTLYLWKISSFPNWLPGVEKTNRILPVM